MISEEATCCYCDIKFGGRIDKTKEHIIPLGKGGLDVAENILACCYHCNNWRGNKTYQEWKSQVKSLLDNNQKRNPFTKQELINIYKNICIIMQTRNTKKSK